MASLQRYSAIFAAGCLGLALVAPGYATERIRWTPDSDRGSVGSTLSGGRRGYAASSCNRSDDATRLALLVPDDRSRLVTTAAHPTLAWHVATTAPVSMTFHLSDPTLAHPLYTQTVEIDQTTTVGVTLPADYPLETDRKYRWTVFVSCPGSHQTEISARSFVERVDGASLDINNLSALDQAAAYAHHGIWYDALAALLTAGSQGITDAESMAQTLLEQGQSQAEISLPALEPQ
ncbi:MAG: DUF928 domain-containing protein [Cyanobacteria bacterium P01_D01_bin.2]